jgi:hypothetical protein
MTAEGEPKPLLVKHADAQRLLGCSASFYWGLVRRGQITVRGSGRAGRADYASLLDYVRALPIRLAEVEKAA